jgi:hypothetical protein
MDYDSFLKTGELRLGHAGAGIEQALIDLNQRHALHPLMREFEAARTAHIEADVRTVRDAVGDTFAPAPCMRKQRKHQLRALHHRLVKWDFAKIREAVALAGLAGSVELPEALHIHDVCGGKGIVALYAVHLRERLGLAGGGTCWELDADREGSHEVIREQWFRCWKSATDAPPTCWPSTPAGPSPTRSSSAPGRPRHRRAPASWR